MEIGNILPIIPAATTQLVSYALVHNNDQSMATTVRKHSHFFLNLHVTVTGRELTCPFVYNPCNKDNSDLLHPHCYTWHQKSKGASHHQRTDSNAWIAGTVVGLESSWVWELTLSNFNASYAVDGDFSTFSHTGSSDANPWRESTLVQCIWPTQSSYWTGVPTQVICLDVSVHYLTQPCQWWMMRT